MLLASAACTVRPFKHSPTASECCLYCDVCCYCYYCNYCCYFSCYSDLSDLTLTYLSTYMC